MLVRASERAREQVERWAKELLDLSRRNTSLYYKPLKRGTLELVAPWPARIHELLAGSKPLSIYYPPPADLLETPWTLEQAVRDAAGTQLVSNRTERSDVEKTLRNLDSQAQADLVDRGLESLYVSFGMLRWQEVPGADEVSSPLIFVPVRLERDSPRDPFRLRRGDGDAVLNPSLRVLMEEMFGILLPEHSAETPADEELSALFDHVSHAVREQGWTVEPVVVLKRATFHKEAMYRDLLDNLEEVAGHSIVSALADPTVLPDDDVVDMGSVPDESDVDDIAPPEQSHLILDADASQRRAIAAALLGTSFVMDGPPGTGKSQTISNLVAELIAGGKTVLFVSEKMAALDVVADRLRNRGLGDFLLELHSHKVSRREVAAELGRALRFHPTARPRLGKAEVQQYRQYRVSLTEYSEAVNRIREPLGRSVHWVLGRLAQLENMLAVAPPAGISLDLSAENVADLMAKFEQLARVWEPAEQGEMFVWRGLEAAGLSQAVRGELLRTLEQLDDALNHLEMLADGIAYAAGLPTPDDLEGADRLAAACALVQAQPVSEPRWWSNAQLDHVAARLDEIESLAPVHEADVNALLAAYGPDWPTLEAATARHALDAREALSTLVVPAVPGDNDTTEVLRERIGFLRQTSNLGRNLPAASAYLAEALGAQVRERTIKETADLAAVACGADAPTRPERRWAIPSVGAQVRQAINVLGPLVQDYQQRHANLAEVFEDGVYDVDLRGLVTRFNEVHRGLRKLGGAYRADKRLIALVSRTRRADKPVRERLAEALSLQKLMAELDERETESRDLLGRYYRPRASNLDAASGALEQLQRATEVLGAEYDAERVAAQLTGEAPADLDLGARAQGMLEDFDKWRAAAARAGFEPAQLEALPPNILREWAEQAGEMTGTLCDAYATGVGLRRQHSDLGTFLDEARRRVAVEERTLGMRASQARDDELLGRFAVGFQTDITAARTGLGWVGELQQVTGGPLRPRAVQQLYGQSETPDPSPLRDAIDEVNKFAEAFASRFDIARQGQLRSELTGTVTHARELVHELLGNPDQIGKWERFVALTSELRHAGWAAPIDMCIEARLARDQVTVTLEKALYTAWFDVMAASDRAVGAARAADLDATVDHFRHLDHALIDNAAEWVVDKCRQRRPKTTVGGAGIIEREAQKKTRHMPVRKLLSEVGEVALTLKPCFMMSPLSVSQFIPPDMRFDVVVFDEASQITPADAVNCIYRGSQLVVAGDDKQLPPTSFFERASGETDDVYEEDQFDEFESMLDLCKGAASMPSIPLRWHYRSKDESLITFSNYSFYEGSLITYPGARTDGADLGVELFTVDGVYKRGGSRDNPIEAEAIADRVVHHAENHPDLTVGVVTFSQAQAEMVERVIEQRRLDRPDLDDWFTVDRLDGFFVKNLESVQGDERDVIIFSIGYGPDEHGKLTLAFGPLSRNGGWRRLNVAITRARRRVEVVASFLPSRLDARGTKHRGVRELLRYLDYADRGISALAVDLSQSEGDVESPLEQSVFDTLRNWGYDVVPQVGAAGYRVDLGVRHSERPGEYMLGVECDGRAYHSSRVARDRDRLRQEVLEGLGWRLHRIWGPSWYRERREQEQRLREALEGATTGERTPPTPSVQPRTERFHEEAPLDQPPEWSVPYRIARVHATSVFFPNEPEAFSENVKIVRAVLEVEAPIHIDLLGRRVADAYQCNLTKKVRRAVDDAVLTLERRGACRRDKDWVWVNDKCPVRVPGDDPDARRSIEHIPPIEIDGAVYLLLRDARVASDEELLTQIGRLFGIQRISNRARTVLEDSLVRLHDRGRIDWDEDGRVRPKQDP